MKYCELQDIPVDESVCEECKKEMYTECFDEDGNCMFQSNLQYED